MTTPLTAYLLESKADWPDPVAEPDLSEPHDPADEEGLEWAGDLYEEGDESDPAEAFATFTGEGGLQGWLDRADDGTLTGWVRDIDGSVYRYSDVDAWAIDVRDASMARTDPADEVDPAEGEEDPAAEGDPEAPDAAVEGDELDPDADRDTDTPDGDDPDADEALLDQQDPAADDDTPPGEAGIDAPDGAPGDLPDEEEDDTFLAKVKRKGEGKSFVVTYHAWEGQ